MMETKGIASEIVALRKRVSELESADAADFASLRSNPPLGEFLNAIIDETSDFVGVSTPDSRVVYLNRAARLALGLGVDEDITHSTLSDYYSPEVARMLEQEAIPAAISDGLWSGETVANALDGREVPVTQVIIAHRDDAGELQFISSISRDISERKRAEEALRRSELRYRSCFENSPTSLWEEDFTDVADRVEELRKQGVTDLEAYLIENPDEVRHLSTLVRIVDVNRAALELHDAPSKDALLGNLEKLFTERSHPAFRAEVVALMNGEESFEAESIVRTLGGERRDINVQLALSPEEGHRSVLLAITDITEHKRAEEAQRRFESQVQQSQRLESLGVLAGGIAHDFNNLLSTIMGNAEFVERAIPADSNLRSGLGDIVTASEQAAGLCRQMLEFAGQGWTEIQNLDLSEVLRETAELLEVSIPRNAVFKLDLADDLPRIDSDASQIRQIAMNLVVNASEAIDKSSGVILLRSGVRDFSKEQLANTVLDDDLPGGPYIFLEVTDNGCGMSESTLATIFDPFFSTKFAGRGLGLAALMGIVRGHRGAVEVETREGNGSTFRVLLPCGQ